MADPANRAKAVRAVREWRRQYPDRYKSDHVKAANRAYVAAHAVEHRLRVQKRKALQRSAAVGTITARDIERLVNRFGGQCAYCRTRPYEHLDHVVPLIRGGPHSLGNLLPACAPCNGSKGPKFLAEWKVRRRAD